MWGNATATSKFAAVVAAMCLLNELACPQLGRADSAKSDPPIELPSAKEVEEKLPRGEHLDGEEIYDRFLKNRKRLKTMYQEGRILSSDTSGNPQVTNFWVRSKDYRDAEDEAVDDIYSKSILKLTGPREMRHTGYLYVHRDEKDDEQFMYSPHRGRTSRVTLKGQNVAGTDFAFDDFLINLDDIRDADYERFDDEVIEGVTCYVVEAKMRDSSATGYSQSVSYFEPEHYVPLKVRYWDDADVEVKIITSPKSSIREFDGAWLPVESKVVNLLEETSSVMHVDELEPNPEIDDYDFSISSLEFRP